MACPFALLLLLLLGSLLPATSSAYFVLTRYSALPQQQPSSDEEMISPLAIRHWPTQQEAASEDSLDQLAQELSVEQWMRPLNLETAITKRTAGTAKTLPGQEHVCQTLIRTDFRPTHGHEQNGTRVEIQQDERRQFSATFIECENTKREHCHGIDNALFSSECVTLFEFRPAGVRLEGSTGDFIEGLVKVPITCQCRLRRKIGNGILQNL